MSRLVVALGGNALLRRGERADATTQRRHAVAAAALLAAATDEHELVVTHGNGPQVGLLALEAEAYGAVPPYPLDVLGAESQAMVGYILAQALANASARTVVIVLTQVVVDADDPAFALPSKPIGPVYDEPAARLLAASRGWSVAPDGEAFRRVVASPEPRELVELPAIELLLESGAVAEMANKRRRADRDRDAASASPSLVRCRLDGAEDRRRRSALSMSSPRSSRALRGTRIEPD